MRTLEELKEEARDRLEEIDDDLKSCSSEAEFYFLEFKKKAEEFCRLNVEKERLEDAVREGNRRELDKLFVYHGQTFEEEEEEK